ASKGSDQLLADVLPWSVTIEGDDVCGGGVIVDKSGLILTDAHVIEGLHSIEVILTDGRSFRARVLEEDAKLDLALLSLDGLGREELPTPTLGSTLILRPGADLY